MGRSLLIGALRAWGVSSVVSFSLLIAGTPSHAQTKVPDGMIPYDHPVIKNGKLVLWHGPSHGGGVPVQAGGSADGGPVRILADASDPTAHRTALDVVAALGAAHQKADFVQGSVTPNGLDKALANDAADFALVSLPALMAQDSAATLRAKAPVVARLGAEVIEIVAPKKFDSPDALNAAKVDVGPEGSPQAVTLAVLFGKLGLHPTLQHHPLDQALSLLQAGKVDAVAAMGAPTPSNVGDFGAKGDFHLVPVAYGAALKDLFVPAARTDRERPHLVATGETVETVAAPVALLSFGEPDPNSAPDKAVQALFDGFAAQSAPWNAPAWSEVNFAAQGVDWPRAKAVDAWLSAHQREADPSLAASKGDGDVNGIYAALTRLRTAEP